MGIIKYLTELTDTPDITPLRNGDPRIYDFVARCLNIDPRQRPSAS